MNFQSAFNPIINCEDDGLLIPSVRAWSIQKYNYVGRYGEIYAITMRSKWNLAYIDLFAGSGLSRIDNTNQIIMGSPLIALSIPTVFAKYIFCEKDPEKMFALKERVKRLFPAKFEKVVFIEGNANEQILKIKREIPTFINGVGTLPFCFVDPYSLDLNFETIQSLGLMPKMDFLILLALHMDANRNYKYYINEENTKIDKFINSTHWRKEVLESNESFVHFLADQYKANMSSLGYKVTDTFQQVRSDAKNLPLYYLAFFSKHDLGNKFWKIVQQHSNAQRKLDL